MHMVEHKDVIQHKVIDMAFVRRDVDNIALSGPVPYHGQLFGICVNTLVDFFPEPRQGNEKKLHISDIVIGSDLVKIGARLFSQLLQSFPVSCGHFFNGSCNLPVLEHLFFELLPGFHNGT